MKMNIEEQVSYLMRGSEYGDEELKKSMADELRQHVAHEIGPIAKPEELGFVDSLPKTRSGKIMRRLLRARALGEPEGDISTLEE